MTVSDTSRRLVLSRHPRNHLHLPDSCTLITPNVVVAHELNSPTITLDDIARDLITGQNRRVASDDLMLRCLRESCSISAESSDRGGIARSAVSAVNLLFRSDAKLDELIDYGSDRVSTIAMLASETRRRLLDMDLICKSDSIGYAAALPVKQMKIVVYGYARLGQTERRLIDAIAADGSTVYLPYFADSKVFEETSRTATFFAEQGWLIETAIDNPIGAGQECADAFLKVRDTVPNAHVYSFPTVRDEVRGVLSRIKADLLDTKYEPQDVTLITRSESLYNPVIREIAWEYELPIQTHDPTAIGQTRFGQWMHDFLNIVAEGEFSFEVVARLLNNPLCSTLVADNFNSSESWVRARADHPNTKESWETHDSDLVLLLWPEQANRKEWAERVTACLHQIVVPSKFATSPQDLAAYERFTESISEMSFPAGELLDRTEFVDQLRDILSCISTQSQQSRVGIQVHTPLSIYGTSIPHVYVLGASEGMLPKSIQDESVLDFHERQYLRKLGLAEIETAAEASRRETLSFYTLLLTAKHEVVFTFPRLMGGTNLECSPLVSRIGIAPEEVSRESGIAASNLELAEFAAADARAESTPLSRQVVRARDIIMNRELGVKNAYTGYINTTFSGDNRIFSAAQLTQFGQCPYKWFGSRLLHVHEPEEASDELDPSIKGNLFHSVLKNAASLALTADDQRLAILNSLDMVFDEVAAGMPELTRLAAWPGRRIELLAQLRKAVVSADFVKDGARIIAAESAFSQLWNGIVVRGVIDRIDQLDNNLLIVDYKSSGSAPLGAKDEKNHLKVDVQLPIYISVEQKLAADGLGISGGYYYSLSKAKCIGKPYDLQDTQRGKQLPSMQLEDLAVRVVDALASGEFPVDPDSDLEACNYCDFDSLCRKGSHLARTRGNE